MPKLAHGAGIEGSSLAGAQPCWGHSLVGDTARQFTGQFYLLDDHTVGANVAEHGYWRCC